MAKDIILTGVKPTGDVHIGNYLGAIRPAIKMANESKDESMLFVANYHALNMLHDPQQLRDNTYQVAATYLACGLDPKKTLIYKQSDVPEITELALILSCFTPKGLMNRAHSYKAKIQQNEIDGKKDLDSGVNMGLFNYPILMSADILMFKAAKVPVGEDQVQHIEMTRDIAQKFNNAYGDILRIPEYVVQKMKLVPGLDGQKMSKSYNNIIPLFCDSKKMRKHIMKVKTDSLGPDEPKNPDDSIIVDLYKEFATPGQLVEFRQKFTDGIAYGYAKEELYELIEKEIAPQRDEFNRLMANRREIEQILDDGGRRARALAQNYMEEIRKAIGIV